MRWDAWVSCAIYTGATVAFYLLGAATLHGAGKEITNDDVITNLSAMYEGAFGEFGKTIFSVGCFCVLFSTVFAATAANARLFADGASVFKFKKYQNEDERHYMVKVGAVVLLVLAFIIYWAFGKPVSLVFMGAFAQGALFFWPSPRFIFSTPEWTVNYIPARFEVFLTSAICMAIIGSYGAFCSERPFLAKKETPAAVEAASSTNAAPAAVEQPKE